VPPWSIVSRLAVALLLAAYFFTAVSASRMKSPTFDEVVHITAGYNAWINHDQRFDPGNGDFVKRWAALPLLVSRPNFPALSGEDWRSAEFFRIGRDFLFHSGNDPASLLFQSRCMVALLGVGLGLLVFACSRQLFGNLGGLVSLTLFAFCPHMLAHGALVSTDLALTFALLASTWFAWRLLHLVSWTNLIGSLLAFSLLVISKMSAVLIVPIAAILIVVRLFNREPWRWSLRTETALAARGRQSVALLVLLIVHGIAGWIAIWAVFDFKYVARADPADTQLMLMRSPGSEIHGIVDDLSNFCHRHHVLPEGYLKGMEELVGISARRPSFMNGHWKVGGGPLFFPYAFWAKTPPALLALLAVGIAGCIWTRKRNGVARSTATTDEAPAAASLYHAIPFLVLFAIYAAVAIRQNVNIGHRHILALYPALYILAGSAVRALPLRKRAVELAVGLLVCWYVGDSLAVRPDYLAYFSPVVGGPSQGYRHLVDSSLDWGQDLPGLQRWLSVRNPDAREPLFFSYFGTGNPEHFGIESQRLPGFPEWRELRVFALTPGIYAISATTFQSLYTPTFGPWNRAYEADYQKALNGLGLTEANAQDQAGLVAALQRHPDAFWQDYYSNFEKLRFGRLCAWLRATKRPPDDQVGHSILIWKLDEHALHDALWEKPAELYEKPVTEVPGGI
jgi:hypothetical protein